MRTLYRAWLVALLAVVTACNAILSDESVYVTAERYLSEMNPAKLPDPNGRQGTVPSADDIDKAYPRPDVTYVTDRSGHGIQVEYFTEDGQVFLWYPGKTQALRGLYRYAGVADPNSPGGLWLKYIEFKYGEDNYNPVTKRWGGWWDRRERRNSRQYLVSYANGDIFNLSSGTVPYQREKCDLPEPLIWLSPQTRSPALCHPDVKTDGTVAGLPSSANTHPAIVGPPN